MLAALAIECEAAGCQALSFFREAPAPYYTGMGLSEPRFRISCVACVSLALVAATPPARAADRPVEPPGEASDLVPVHLTSPVPVLLRRLAPGDDAFVDLCVSPCDIGVPRDGEYVIDDAQGNRGVRDSRPFRMPADALRADIGVEPRTQGGLLAGIIVSVTGASMMVFAGLWAIVKTLPDWGPNWDNANPPQPDQSGPIALAVVGAVVALAGIPVIAENAHSGVTVNAPAAPPTPAPFSPLAALESQMAVLRAMSPERRAPPAAVGIPLIRVAF